MGKHDTHRIHENTREAWEAFDMSRREQEICRLYSRYGWLTDREVCTRLGSRDMNYARPTITHLVDAGTITEHPEKIKCKDTNRSVRRCNISPYPKYEPTVKPDSEEITEDDINRAIRHASKPPVTGVPVKYVEALKAILEAERTQKAGNQ